MIDTGTLGKQSKSYKIRIKLLKYGVKADKRDTNHSKLYKEQLRELEIFNLEKQTGVTSSVAPPRVIPTDRELRLLIESRWERSMIDGR